MDYVPGIDISVWQTNDAKNPTRFFDPVIARDKGIRFAYIRASSGLLKDKAMDTFAQTFLEAGIPIGFYHYAYPDYPYGSQVDKFIEYTKGYKQDLPIVLDLEQSGVGLSFTQAFLGRLESKTGRQPMIYTSPGFWSGLSGSGNAIWAKEYPLWIANYPNLKQPVYHNPDLIYSVKPAIPAPWTDWTFWQYTSLGDGYFYGGKYGYPAQTGLDLNVFNGDYNDFNYFLGGVIPEEPEQPPVIKQEWVRAIPAAWLSFRSRPEIYTGDRPAIARGVEAKVLKKLKTDINWYYVELSGGDKGYISAEPGFTEIFYRE